MLTDSARRKIKLFRIYLLLQSTMELLFTNFHRHLFKAVHLNNIFLCSSHVSDMFQSCIRHVSAMYQNMFQPCIRHAPNMFQLYVSEHALDMYQSMFQTCRRTCVKHVPAHAPDTLQDPITQLARFMSCTSLSTNGDH